MSSSSDLMLEPEWYSPNVDDSGRYVDKVPHFNVLKSGVRCPCGSRRDKVFSSSATFQTHMKSKIHQKWMEELNLNRLNLYVENVNLKALVDSQKRQIAQYELDVKKRAMTIDLLTMEIMKLKEKEKEKENKEENLLDL